MDCRDSQEKSGYTLYIADSQFIFDAIFMTFHTSDAIYNTILRFPPSQHLTIHFRIPSRLTFTLTLAPLSFGHHAIEVQSCSLDFCHQMSTLQVQCSCIFQKFNWNLKLSFNCNTRLACSSFSLNWSPIGARSIMLLYKHFRNSKFKIIINQKGLE